jgi:hypothetical protein
VSPRIAAILAAVTVLGGCAADPAAPSPGASTPSPTPTPAAPPTSTRMLTLDDGSPCHVTIGQDWDPPAGVGKGSLFGAGSSHGNGTLWVGGLWEGGVLAAGRDFIEEDGSVGMKFGWWRHASGRLTITGRRLDGPAPPLRAHIPDGYGDRGFQATGLSFPTEGCWEVTGQLAGTTLTFVTLVKKVSP